MEEKHDYSMRVTSEDKVIKGEEPADNNGDAENV